MRGVRRVDCVSSRQYNECGRRNKLSGALYFFAWPAKACQITGPGRQQESERGEGVGLRCL